MSLYVKIILVIFGLAYLISPLDVIPDLLLPYIGWIDDGLILATIFYLIRYGKLPGFLFRAKGGEPPSQNGNGPHSRADRSRQRESGPGHFRPGEDRNAPRSPHEILGIKPHATKKEIQDAYKSGIKKYHPDKLSHLGEEFSRLANKKFLEIQAAYDTLMKK